MKSSAFRRSLIAMAITCMFSWAGAAKAESLPPALQTAAAQVGATIASDGSFTFNGTQYVPLLPPGYDPAVDPSGNPQFASDGSLTWGNLQFAPVLDAPGAMPGLPPNLQVLPGNALPSDFQPPAGFVPLPSTPLPSGVTVPPLSYADLIGEMVTAGLLPADLVQFNSDGSALVGGSTSYMPFLPPSDQQGRGQNPEQRSFSFGASGEVIFPDGSTLVPLVSGQNAGGTTLPATFTPPANTALPTNVALPPQFEIPASMPLPAGVTLPAGVVIPENYTLPSNVSLPPGVSIPDSVTLPAGVTVPPGITLPAGTQLRSTSALPAGTTILPNGSMVVPGTQIPAGVVPPSTWTAPSGTTQNADGSMTLPTPPSHGFDMPTMPMSVNADGSVVMPALASGQTLPAGATLNADGTYTMPAPPFIGSVGSDGTVVAPSGGTGMPEGYMPTYEPGAALPGAGVMPTGTTWTPPTTEPGMPGGGTMPPTDGGGTTPPAGGGGTTPPTGGGGTMPPAGGGGSTPPADGGGMPPPPSGGGGMMGP